MLTKLNNGVNGIRLHFIFELEEFDKFSYSDFINTLNKNDGNLIHEELKSYLAEFLEFELKNFFNEFHENINRSYEKPYYDNLIRQQRAPKEIENYFNSMELKMPELLQCLAELKIDKAKKIEQEIFTNIDNAINWYYKFYPAKTDDEKDSLLTVEFKRNKTKKAIQELIKRIENKSTIEEARIILEEFNFTLPENKTKKSYII